MNIVKIDKTELDNFLDYILDKTEDCYKEEVKQSIDRFKKENVKQSKLNQEEWKNEKKINKLLF